MSNQVEPPRRRPSDVGRGSAQATSARGDDGRTRIKERHRAAILNAAEALMSEQHELGLTVEELATRAGVSRRTVFNHFASLDEVMLAVCNRILAPALDELRQTVRGFASTTRGQGETLAPIVDWLNRPTLPASIRELSALLPLSRTDPRARWLTHSLSLSAANDLFDELSTCYRACEDSDIRLLADVTAHGLAILGWHWATCLDPNHPAALATWQRLVDEFAAGLRAALALRSRTRMEVRSSTPRIPGPVDADSPNREAGRHSQDHQRARRDFRVTRVVD